MWGTPEEDSMYRWAQSAFLDTKLFQCPSEYILFLNIGYSGKQTYFRKVAALPIHLPLQGGREHGEDSPAWYLLGLVSAGSSHCGDGNPGLYTRWKVFQYSSIPLHLFIRTESYLPWIKKTIGIR